MGKIYKDYSYIENNSLDLSSFIEDFKENSGSIYEKEEIILETKVKNGNKYKEQKKLYIDKKTLLPTKMEVQDINKNTLVYILYNKIELND